MKKFISTALAVMLSALLLTACGSKNTPADTATYDVNEILNKINTLTPVTEPNDISEVTLKIDMGLDMADVKSYAGKESLMTNQYSDIILVIEAAEGKIDIIKSALEALQQQRVKSYELYEPAQAEKAANGKIVVKGNYAVLVIAENGEKNVEQAIDEAFK